MSGTHTTPEQERLQAEIAAQREQLADTVDALTAKLDVKAQAKAHQAQLAYVGAAIVSFAVVWAVWKRVRS